ncbi:DUF6531 domain-containing protein, partial [Paenibacillus illinoisensis]|uniref:RHS repeat domain-containing protein n=1 Tax=Paenibacillus illinoisensis TaxID=59845 RepID=UPI0036F295D5
STRHDTGLSDAEKAAAASAVGGTGSAAAASMIKKTPGGSAPKGAEAPGAPKTKDVDASPHQPSTGRTTETQNVTKSNKESCPGDPIHAATGHQFMNHDILTLHGATDWPLTLIYHSGLLQRGELGPAWTHQYGLRLHIHPSTQDLTEHATSVDVYWTAGRHNHFIHQADGTYRSSDLDVYWDVLEREVDGWKLTTREPREIYRFTEEGQLLSHTQSSGLTLDLSYQQSGRLATLIDRATQRSLHLDYTPTGELKEVKDALRCVTFEYSSAGVLARVIEPGGVVTDLISDEEGRLISLTESGILQFTNTFDTTYRIVEQTDAAGGKFQFQYDTESHPGQTWTTVTNRLGQTRTLVHDDALQLLEVHAEDGGITRYTYTPQGQLSSVTNPLEETMSCGYDEDGHLIREIDPLGHETEYHYTAHHQVARETDAEGGVTSYQYDEQQRLTEVTRPDGSTAKWTYTE